MSSLRRGSPLTGMLVIGLGTLIVPLDTSVNIAFPDITSSFAIPIADIQWVVLSYVLIYVALLLAFGKLGDLFGHKRIFLIGLAVSALAFAACALAPSYQWLLGARVLQGIGAAFVLSCGAALATALFPESGRSRALGVYTMMFGIGAAAGPSLGGFMVQAWGWEAVFWFRLPICLAALVALPWLSDAQGARRTGGFDLSGALLLALGLAALMYALNRLRVDPVSGLLIALLGTLALAVFVRREITAAEPIVPMAAFRRLDFSVLNIFNTLVMLVGFAPYLIVPYFLVRVTDYSLATSGLILAISAVGQAIAAPLGGWLLSQRPLSLGASAFALLGAVMVALATLAIATWGEGVTIATIAGPMFMQGLGLGLFQLCILDVVTQRLDVRDRGVAGSLAQVSRTLGVVLGATCLSLIFAHLRQSGAHDGLNEMAAFLAAFQMTFFIAGGGLLLCLALTLMRPRLWFNADQ